MSLTRQQKEQHVKEVSQSLMSATSVVFISYDKLNVAAVNELRDNLHAAGGAMRVVPKRLLQLALKSAKINFDPTAHQGQLAVAWGEDAVAPAKVLNTFAKQNTGIMTLLAGTLEGNDLTLDEVTALAELPGRDQLLGQLLSVLSGPARGLVTVLTGVQRDTVNVLKAIADQKGSP